MAVTMKSSSSVELVCFGAGHKTEPKSKEILGGKGANLVEMASMGFPVPPGFVIPCSASVTYLKSNSSMSQVLFLNGLWAQVANGIKFLEGAFGYMPLVSVRSGARVSMPGMMDTILNVGLTSDTLPFWVDRLGERTALDSYRRLLQMYGSVVFEIPMALFDDALEEAKHSAGVTNDSDLSVDDLCELITEYERVFSETGHTMPDTVSDQIHGAIKAVFSSWDNPRAIEYRKIHGYPGDWGTAVTVQSMVFGNLNDKSATGVLFTRCPSTGDSGIVGEFLVNAQGEDVVAGIRTPDPLTKMSDWNPEVHSLLTDTVCKLETYYRDMQDVEFTIQDGELFILQTRAGKRSPEAAVRVAVDLVNEALITTEEALSRVSQKQLLSLMQDKIDPSFKEPPHLTGIAAGGGLVVGRAVFTSEAAINCNEPCILVRKETDPDDIGGMNASVGILTATGGLTSHAAVVARGMNKTCVVGCTMMEWQESPPKAHVTGKCVEFTEGSKITIDGSTGNVWVGLDVPVVPGGLSEDMKTLLGWAMAGAPHRITLPADEPQNWLKLLEAEEATSVYVDTANLDPAYASNSGDYYDVVSKLGKALEACSAESITLDLTTACDLWGPDDMTLVHMIEKRDPALGLSGKVAGVLEFSGALMSRLTVTADGLTNQQKKLLLKAGAKVKSPIQTVADLLTASGEVQVSKDVLDSVFGGKEAFATLCAMVEASTGKKLSGGSPVYWYEALNKVS